MLNSKGFSSRILRGGWNTCKRAKHKREIDITKGVGNKSQNELKIECAPPADAAKACMSNRKWRFDCQESEDRRLCTLRIAHSQYTRDIVPPGLACQRLHLKYIFVENWATAVKTKNKCVCFLLIFSVSVCRIAVRNEFNGNLFCLLLKNCQLHTQFSFNYAICNLRLWPRQLIITWSHLLHSQHRASASHWPVNMSVSARSRSLRPASSMNFY